MNQILQMEILTLDIGNLVLDIREWIKKFQDFRLQFSYRWSNVAAHDKVDNDRLMMVNK